MPVAIKDDGFWDLVAETQQRLSRLDSDISFAGVIRQFGLLVAALPPDFCKVEVMVASGAKDNNPTVVIRPGPDLKVIAASLRALDFHKLPSSPTTFRISRSYGYAQANEKKPAS